MTEQEFQRMRSDIDELKAWRARIDPEKRIMTVTDKEVEAELKAPPALSERRKCEVALEDARQWAREAIGAMKLRRSQGRATEKDEMYYTGQLARIRKAIAFAQGDLAACPPS